jgi:hypothetical protein
LSQLGEWGEEATDVQRMEGTGPIKRPACTGQSLTPEVSLVHMSIVPILKKAETDNHTSKASFILELLGGKYKYKLEEAGEET